MPGPGIAGAAAPAPPAGNQYMQMGQQGPTGAGPAGAQAQQNQTIQAMGDFRQAADVIRALGEKYPVVGQNVQQVLQQINEMVVRVADAASAQTASSMMVPTAGM